MALRGGRRARKEPHLAGKIAGSVFSPQDHQVDNRKLSAALRIAAEAAGAKIHEHQAVKEIAVQGGRATGVVLEDGTHVAADRVVLAAGAWSRSIAGLPPDRRPPVRPIKGQMLALRMDAERAAPQSRAVGAGRLSGAAPRRPPDCRRARWRKKALTKRSPPAAC